jgi:hypothetical protein
LHPEEFPEFTPTDYFLGPPSCACRAQETK